MLCVRYCLIVMLKAVKCLYIGPPYKYHNCIDITGMNSANHIPFPCASLHTPPTHTHIQPTPHTPKHIPHSPISTYTCLYLSPTSTYSLLFLLLLFLSPSLLQRIPPDIVKLTSLIHLDLSGNKLRSLPSELGDMTHLRELLFNNNALRSLPYELGKLFLLQVNTQ